MPDKKYRATIIDNDTHVMRIEDFKAVHMEEACGISDGFVKQNEQIIRIELLEKLPPKKIISGL